MSKRRDPEWRIRAAADLLIQALPELGLPGPVLLMEEPSPKVARAMIASGLEVVTWLRRCFGGREAAAWPPAGIYPSAVLRLPRAKEELAMCLHASASRLTPGGTLLVYGANDEGIRAAPAAMAGLFASEVDVVAVGGRCRILRAHRNLKVDGLKAALADWRVVLALDHPDLPPSWVSYPGLFAHGRVDPGTRLLLGALPRLPGRVRALDFGCGSGVVGHVVRNRGQHVTVELLDVDAVALEAARENVPGTPLLLHDGLPPPAAGPFDVIVSNPPFHMGKGEQAGLVTSLVRESPGLLGPEGLLLFVTQRRFPVEGPLRRHFFNVEALTEDATFRVWKGFRPRLKEAR